MSNNILMIDNRQLVPRWHTSDKAFAANYSSFKQKENGVIENEPYFKESLSNWLQEKNIPNAVDLLSRFISSNNFSHKNYHEVLEYLLSSYETHPPELKRLLNESKKVDEEYGYSEDLKSIGSKINELRSKVRNHPLNAFAWLDLSFYYTVLGQKDKAVECASIANNIHPDNPYILRSFSRLLVHVQEHEHAQWLLSKSKQKNTNPLIASALISIEQAFSEIGSVNINKARALISDFSGHPIFSSELAATIATLDIKNGSVQKGKKLFKQALIFPTENVLAQSKWLEFQQGVKVSTEEFNGTSEGAASKFYSEGNFEECRKMLMSSYEFQPYSSDAINGAAYISLVALDDPEFVINLSEGRIHKPQMSFMELNNLIVAKIMAGQREGIESDISLLKRKVDMDDAHCKSIYAATSGMYLLDNNHVDLGKVRYEEAIKLLNSKKFYREATLATYFYHKMLQSHEPDYALILKDKVNKVAKTLNLKELLS